MPENTGCPQILSPPAYRLQKEFRLIPLYQTLIRSILDYGSPVYGLAPKSQLALLDPIQNYAIRICTVVFRTSPQLSLYSDSGLPPLPIHYRRLALFATLTSSILCLPNTHVHELLFNTKLKHYTYYRAHSSLPNYLQRSLAKNICFHCLQPIFSSSPPWTFTKPVINLQLMELPKKTTSPITYRERFQSLINKHPNTNISYTDGSKTNNRAGPCLLH